MIKVEQSCKKKNGDLPGKSEARASLKIAGVYHCPVGLTFHLEKSITQSK